MKNRCDVLKPKLLLAVFAFYFIFSSPVVFAQFGLFGEGNIYSTDIRNMVKVIIPGARDEWLTIPNFFYFIVFPFIAAWAVIYGIMEEIGLFRRAKTAHKVVSFVMAAMLLPSGWLLVIVNYFYMFDAWLALMAFGVVFFFGIFFWGHGTLMGIQGSRADYRRQKVYDQMWSEMQKYQNEINRILEDKKMDPQRAAERIGEIKVKMQALRDRMQVVTST